MNKFINDPDNLTAELLEGSTGEGPAGRDRLRVLTTELRRLVPEGSFRALVLDGPCAIDAERLRPILGWV